MKPKTAAYVVAGVVAVALLSGIVHTITGDSGDDSKAAASARSSASSASAFAARISSSAERVATASSKASASAAAKQAAIDEFMANIEPSISQANSYLTDLQNSVNDYLAGKVKAIDLQNVSGVLTHFFFQNSEAMSITKVPAAAGMSDVQQKIAAAMDKFGQAAGDLLGFGTQPLVSIPQYGDNLKAGLALWNDAITKAYSAAGRTAAPTHSA